MNHIKLLTAALGAFFYISTSHALTIDFEASGLALGEGAALSSVTVGGVTATFTNAMLAFPGGSAGSPNAHAFFTNLGNDIAVVDSGYFITDPLGGGSPVAPTGPIDIVFSTSVTGVNFDLMDLNQMGLETLTATIYSDAIGGTVVETLTRNQLTDPGFGEASFKNVAFTSLAGISALRIDVTSTGPQGLLGFGIDNLAFAPVPEPAAALLYAVGLTTVGWRVRRKNPLRG